MAGILNLVYSIAVVLVAVGGLAFVFGTTGDTSHKGLKGLSWQAVAVTAAVGLFLAAIVVDLGGFL